MKNLILLFAVSFFLCSCEEIKPKLESIVLSGKIKNYGDSTIKLVQNKYEQEIVVNAEGNFLDTIYDFEAGYFKLVIGKEYTNLFLKNGSNIALTVNADAVDETIKYNGIGANENNFLAQKTKQAGDFNYWHFSKNEEAVFKAKVDSFTNFNIQFLEEYKQMIPEFDKGFYKLELNNNLYFGAFLKEKFKQVHSYYTKNDSFEVSDNFYSYRKNIPLENKEALNTKYYADYVLANVENNIVENDTTEEAFEALRIINRSFQDNELKKEFIYRSAKKELKKVKKLDEYWTLVSFMVTNKTHLKELKKDFRKISKIQVGKKSPQTAFKDKEGNEHKLADFIGKYIYIDMWAQWCAPCKAEAPFLKKLEEKYAENDIVFLKISLDEDQEAWKNYIVENNATKNAFILDKNFDSEFVEAYLITSIPRFILLDKELKIIDADAKRPSNNEIEKQLDDLLNV